jgi:large subunit ribosomal protein L4
MAIKVVELTKEERGSLGLDQEMAESGTHHIYLGMQYQLNRERQGTASTKTKGEVSGGGRKPYKQKGTGRARRGSNRTPLMPGGGVTFGPKYRSYATGLNQKIVKKSVVSALITRERLLKLSGVEDKSRTKDCRKVIDEVGSAVIVIRDEFDPVYKAVRNFASIEIVTARYLKIDRLLSHPVVVFSQDALGVLA